MLRRVGIDGNIAEKNRRDIDGTGAQVRIADAGFPVPFAHSLEFNAPVHGTWNIVHIGMLVPECHQIYVCADNCMRGVVLTAAEMDAADRFSSVLIEEDDLYDENLEAITIEGVTDAINRLPYRPRAVALFLVCLHHFVGTDAAYVFRTLEERFPHIDFMRCWMDPVMQKTGLTPEQKLKEAMFRPVRPLPADPRLICVLGDNQPLDPDCDLAALAREHGCRILQLHAGNLAYKGTRSGDMTSTVSGCRPPSSSPEAPPGSMASPSWPSGWAAPSSTCRPQPARRRSWRREDSWRKPCGRSVREHRIQKASMMLRKKEAEY